MGFAAPPFTQMVFQKLEDYLKREKRIGFFSSKWPKILYKYTSASTGRLILQNKTIRFSSPLAFDDPYDCFVPVRFDLLPKEQLNDFYNNIPFISFMRHPGQPMFGYGQVRILRAKHRSSLSWQLYRTPLKYKSGVYSNFINHYIKVFCLSKRNNDLLLWSLYGDKHKGICISFSTDYVGANSPPNAIVKVRYQSEFPTILPEWSMDTSIDATIIQQAKWKSNHWRSQQEYRFVISSEKPSLTTDVEIEPQAIREIIFGCNAPADDIRSIVELINNGSEFSHIKLFSACRKKSGYRLYINPIIRQNDVLLSKWPARYKIN